MSVRLIVWDNATDLEEGCVIEMEPGVRYVFGDHYYSVALHAEGVREFTDVRVFDLDPPYAWPLENEQ